jgi:hypothetical protein
MTKAISPNSRCFCGSGKKYKNCHGAASAAASAKKFPVGYVVAAAIVLVVVALAFYKSQDRGGPGGAPGAAPAGKVWSTEHGHWHDAP